MSHDQLVQRFTKCESEDLCFISLKPFTPSDPIILTYHHELGHMVKIHPKYGLVSISKNAVD